MDELTCRQAERIGRELGFPSYSKALHSAARRPDETGVTWVPELARVFGSEKPQEPRRVENRVKSHGWRVRLSPEAHRLLNARMKRLGFSTKQAYLENLIIAELGAERRFQELREERHESIPHR